MSRKQTEPLQCKLRVWLLCSLFGGEAAPSSSLAVSALGFHEPTQVHALRKQLRGEEEEWQPLPLEGVSLGKRLVVTALARSQDASPGSAFA